MNLNNTILRILSFRKEKTRVILFYFLYFILYVNSVHGQSDLLHKRIILSGFTYEVEGLFNELTSNYEIYFSYNDKAIKCQAEIHFTRKNYTLQEILKVVEVQCNISYTIQGDIIILKPKKIEKKYSVSGYIEDASTGERLINANVYDTVVYRGTISNRYGFYSLQLEEGDNILFFNYIGYSRKPVRVSLKGDTIINVSLTPSVKLEEVIIYGDDMKSLFIDKNPSMVKLPATHIKKLPSLIGEPDVIKALQLLPGLQMGREGSSSMYVRGGGPDQNLILLDDVSVYNANHLFGFFSVFNSDAIRDVKLYKGAFPARFGGRVSSVLDIRTKEGNTKEHKGMGSIGLMSSRVTYEGPIVENKASFIISARRTYFDVLTRGLFKDGLDVDLRKAYFYDISGKLSYKINQKNSLYLSVYQGQDKFRTGDDTEYRDYEEGMTMGNAVSSLRWNTILGKRLFANTTLSYSEYKYRYDNLSQSSAEQYDSEFNTSIEDVAIKTDFDFLPLPNHTIKFGAGYLYHSFYPGSDKEHYYHSFSDYEYYTENREKSIFTHEFNSYIEDEIKFLQYLNTNIGIHLSGCQVEQTFYSSIQPRISTTYSKNKLSLTGGYAYMTQYLHMLPDKGFNSITDLWLPVTSKVKPVNAHQYSLGSTYQITLDWIISNEVFYKDMRGIVEFIDATNYKGENTPWEEMIEVGKGWSYGTEFLLQKTTGRFTGWLGYTLSWSYRKLSNGKVLPYKYDRRHDISAVISYDINDHITFGALWVYATGHLMTLPSIKYPSLYQYTDRGFDVDINYYEDKNNFKVPDYHRLDVNLNFYKKVKKGTNIFSLGIYNLYCRKNPFHIYLSKDNWGNLQMKSMCILPFAPEIRNSFNF